MPPAFDPTPRKSRGTVRMEQSTLVTSIADFARADEMEMDYVLESAIDQLEAQNSENVSCGLGDLMVRFGDLGFQKTARFDFEPPPGSKKWPGPSHGSFPLHQAISDVGSTTKTVPTENWRRRQLADKTEERVKYLGRAKLFRSDHKTNPQTQKSPPPQDHRSIPARNPPLSLLNLPAELRNTIWSMVAIRKDPIEAQLRKTRSCKQKRNQKRTIIRKFPQEPSASMVSRQMRREVLSIFYGGNTFAFEKIGYIVFKDLSMTDPASMMKWKPGGNFASYLSQIDLRFAASLPQRSPSVFSVIYRLRRADGKTTMSITIEKKGAKLDYCLCLEEASALIKEMSDSDLLDVAIHIIRQLREGNIMNRNLDKMIADWDRKCKKCDKEVLSYSGVGL